MSKKLVTFCTRNGEYEYFDYGIYNEGMSEEELCKNFFGLSKINRLEDDREEFWNDFMETAHYVYGDSDITEKDIKIISKFNIAKEEN
jgi:hypothetical protein